MTKLKFSDLTEKQKTILSNGLLLAAIASTRVLHTGQSIRVAAILEEAAKQLPDGPGAYDLMCEIYAFTAEELMSELEELCKS